MDTLRTTFYNLYNEFIKQATKPRAKGGDNLEGFVNFIMDTIYAPFLSPSEVYF
jgi:hypothetical protein